jgi:hypothetical protein
VTEAKGNTLKNNLQRAHMLLEKGVWQTMLPEMSYRMQYREEGKDDLVFTQDAINDIEVYFAFNFSNEDANAQVMESVDDFNSRLGTMKNLHSSLQSLHDQGHPQYGFQESIVEFPFSKPAKELAAYARTFDERVRNWSTNLNKLYE